MSNRRTGPLMNGGRLLPIAPREVQPPTISERSSLQERAIDGPKNRLTQRSRRGCWTCRVSLPFIEISDYHPKILPQANKTIPNQQNRKVKCDEGRPSCNQCTRLGHTCDYSPKLSFKDETLKTVRKFHPDSSDRPWDTSAELSAIRSPQSPRHIDSLTPVTTSSTEEDLQREAERQRPGTFFVVANPDSFRDTEEYQHGQKNDATSASQGTPSNTTSDSTTLILADWDSFIDNPVSDPQNSPVSLAPAATSSVLTQMIDRDTHSGSPCAFSQTFDCLHVSPPSEGDAMVHLTSHYRNVIRNHISYACGGGRFGMNVVDSQDLFEKEAEKFPPLRHAILALSALSLFYRERTPKIDALQHYEQALEPLRGLRGEEELASDGALLTHFILLLYEIAGTEKRPFWTSHMSSLARIVHIRRRLLGVEPYPCIVWWIFLVDLNALLSGSGSAEFIDTLTSADMVPTETEMRASQSFVGSGALFGQAEPEILSAAWQFQREVSLIAAEIGRFALQIREILSRQQDIPTTETLLHWQQRSLSYSDMLKRCWGTRMRPNLLKYIAEHTISDSVGAVLDFTRLTYEVCLIYTHCMMWPTQQFDLVSGGNAEVSQAAATILDMAAIRVEGEIFEIRSLVLPVLLAGIFVDSASQKMRALEFLRALENESVGSNTKYTRCLLEKVYERQNQKLMVSRELDVDCILIMREMGEQTVHFGL